LRHLCAPYAKTGPALFHLFKLWLFAIIASEKENTGGCGMAKYGDRIASILPWAVMMTFIGVIALNFAL